jgi:hypothetical protein
VKEGIGVVVVGEAVSSCLAARGGARSDVVVKLLEDKVKDKSGEDTAKGTPLSEAFELWEKGPQGSGCKEPAGVCFVI